MRKIMILKVVPLIVSLFLFSGCASIFNPYKSTFRCPETDPGKCLPIMDAYMESLKDEKQKKDKKRKEEKDEVLLRKKEKTKIEEYYSTSSHTQKAEEANLSPEAKPLEDKGEALGRVADITEYQDALYKRLAGLLKEPTTPLLVPPQVVRVLFLSYTGEEDELYMPRYIYFFVDKPRWILEGITYNQAVE